MFIACIEPTNIYMDLDRYWHGGSQEYAGGDQLLTVLRQGWQMDRVVYRIDYPLSDGRQISVYHCILRREDQKLTMPVIANPIVLRVLDTMQARVMPVKPMKTHVKYESRPRKPSAAKVLTAQA